MTLESLSVRLLATNVNPAHVNPDNFRFNGIIPPGWEVIRPVTLESGLSRLNYQNGLSIIASQSNIFFGQRSLDDLEVELVVLEVARRYLDQRPVNFQMSSVIIGPAFIATESNPKERLLSLPALAAPYEGITPSVSIRSVYQLGDKRIDITVEEKPPTSGGEDTPLIIRGRVSYTVRGRSPADGLEYVRSTLENQETDLETFLEINRSVCAQYLGYGAQL